MAPKKKPTDELKDQRVPIMMSEDELKAIDDWRFKNRIGSRGEAIRRLCQAAIIVDENHLRLGEEVVNIMTLVGDFKESRKTPSGGRSTASFLDDLLPELYGLLGRAASISGASVAMGRGETFADAMTEQNVFKELVKTYDDNVEKLRNQRKEEVSRRKKE